MRHLTPFVIAAIVVGSSPSFGDDTEKRTSAEIYLQDVKPILSERCFACHGALKQESGLRLDTAKAIRAGGDSGEIVVVGHPESSLIIERVSVPDESLRMPPEGEPLSGEEIEALTRWIEAGAIGPENEQPEADPQQHWAFLPIKRPPLPGVSNVDLAQGPIDHFIISRQEEVGLRPSPPAANSTLLRRVYLDLVGLPPTRDQMHAFLDDTSPDAYEKVVDALLQKSEYGERWGRHWMDVWRYSDWYGRRAVPDVMNSYPHVWRWRDWIVRSLNEDKGYDQMVREMLAADELCPNEDDNVVATGFLVRNWFKWNYNQWMKDNVEHVGKAFLGLTLNCCHCHDHKYDPISQKEYFAFRAFFEPLELRQDRVPGLPNPGQFQKYVYAESYGPIEAGMIRVFDERLDAETYMYERGDARNRIAGVPPVEPGVPSILGGELTIAAVDLSAEAHNPGLRAFVLEEERAKRQQSIEAAEAALASAKTAYESQFASKQALADAARQQLEETRLEFPGTDGQALSGEYSLLMDASQGRRILSNPLQELSTFDDTTTASFKLRIIQDGLANFQLSPDIEGGLTGGYIVFASGKIRTYKVGSHTEIEVGTYDFAAGQETFLVELVFSPSSTQFSLSVTSIPDGELLVSAAPAATNGWNPVEDTNQGIFLDVHQGTIAAYDDIVFRNKSDLVSFNFEPPIYSPKSDIESSDSWTVSRYSSGAASSSISNLGTTPEAVLLAERVAERADAECKLLDAAVFAANLSLEFAKADIASLEAKIVAEKARSFGDKASHQPLLEAALRAERDCEILRGKTEVARAQFDIWNARAMAYEDGKRAEKLSEAEQALITAQSQLAKAEKSTNETSAEYGWITPRYPTQSTGRRTALAEWITSDDNPLAARVAVNHIWMRHFGQPLVATVSDFGRNGQPPTHPALLDWLAAELIEHNWSMKHLHRLIVTSNTYRKQSGMANASEIAGGVDPDNQLLWRFNTLRMDAEVVRDSVLYVAGELDPTVGGQEIDHAEGLTSKRRSLYYASHGESQMQMLDLFDAPNVCDCYRRTTSIAPQQALALANNPLVLNCSRRLAARIAADVIEDQPTDLITAAFEQVLNRAPSAEELKLSRDFLARQTAIITANPSDGSQEIDEGLVPPAAKPSQRAFENLVHALFNHNDFVTIR